MSNLPLYGNTFIVRDLPLGTRVYSAENGKTRESFCLQLESSMVEKYLTFQMAKRNTEISFVPIPLLQKCSEIWSGWRKRLLVPKLLKAIAKIRKIVLLNPIVQSGQTTSHG